MIAQGQRRILSRVNILMTLAASPDRSVESEDFHVADGNA